MPRDHTTSRVPLPLPDRTLQDYLELARDPEGPGPEGVLWLLRRLGAIRYSGRSADLFRAENLMYFAHTGDLEEVG